MLVCTYCRFSHIPTCRPWSYHFSRIHSPDKILGLASWSKDLGSRILAEYFGLVSAGTRKHKVPATIS